MADITVPRGQQNRIQNNKNNSTIFVRNLPFSTNVFDLKSLFSKFGSIEKCFLVRDKGVVDKCRGMGYVTFEHSEEAINATKSDINHMGRQVISCLAGAKETTKCIKAKEKVPSHMVVAVTGISSSDVRSCIDSEVANFQNFKYSKKISGVNDEIILHISFSNHKSAVKALNKLKTSTFCKEVKKITLLSKLKREVESSHDTLDIQSKTKRKQQQIKLKGKPRLIIRNLSFKCDEKQLKEAFEKYGKITDVKILQKENKMVGCAFVEYENMVDADNAVVEMNGSPLLGRQIAVDWAIAKSKYESKLCSTNNGVEDKHNSNAISTCTSIEESDIEDTNSDTENSDTSSVLDETSSKKKTEHEPDANDGKTVFIRNLSFDATEENLFEVCKQFGPVQYVTLCYNSDTGHSKGTAFVKFYKEDSASVFVEKASQLTDGLMIDSRRIEVLPALNKKDAAAVFDKKQQKTHKDNRNLHLVREGLIRAGTEAAEGTPAADLKKREALMAWKKLRLKNLNYFVSPTRLCVRNLPLCVDDRKLKHVYMRAGASGGTGVKITEARVMRDMQRTNSEGIGRSKRFGFVEFADHQHALAALRSTNNNPELFGDNKRLIVEFSIENKVAINKKQIRMEKSQAKQKVVGNMNNNKLKNIKTKQDAKKNVQPGGRRVDQVGKLGLPSHLGPKIRHRNRGNLRPNSMNKISSKRKNKQNVDNKRIVLEKSKIQHVKKQQKSIVVPSDSFDKLIDKYKTKLTNKNVQKSKWFE